MRKLLKTAISILLVSVLLMGMSVAAYAETKDTVAAGKDVQNWTGWIVDRDCIGVDVIKHTKGCNLMGAEKTPPDSCFGSGLGLVVYVKDKAVTEYKSNVYPDYLIFDGESREIARNFLNRLPSDWSKNLTVKVSGYKVSDIPANADETSVPETDSSKVAKHLEGIHVVSIETTSIQGVSTNVLPVPSLVVTAETPQAAATTAPAMDMPMGEEKTDNDATAAISVTLNGSPLTLDVPPTVVHDKKLLPLRKIAEALGAAVGWDNASKTVTVVKGQTTLKLIQGQTKYTVNEIEKTAEAAFAVVNGRTLVPAAVISESFGVEISYNDMSGSFVITSK
jgi:hypothetical protein